MGQLYVSENRKRLIDVVPYFNGHFNIVQTFRALHVIKKGEINNEREVRREKK